ncbi:MAG: hypothetical protein EXR55_01790 [Dehalococcoidia bacterium]|nr:hypothetical protein [Dehalococcoidia bacterium]
MGITNRKRHEPIIDALPEFFPYRDEGCEVTPSCLRCPLSQCKYDDPLEYQSRKRDQRDQEVLGVRLQEGAKVIELARRFDLSVRTVHRILARGRACPAPTPRQVAKGKGSG